MKKINYIKSSAFIISLIIVLLIPICFVYAQNGVTPTPQDPAMGSNPATIQNPLGENNTSVQALLLKIMNLVATVGAIIVVFFIIYSGFKFVTARGNPAEVSKAKDIFFATIIGGAILLGADIIANIVVNTVNTTVGRSG